MKTINRTLSSALPLLMLIPLACQAQTHTPAQPSASYPIAIDCEHRYISQVDASRVLGTANFSQTYEKRKTLYANVARTCHRGVRQVLLLTDVPAERHRTLASR